MNIRSPSELIDYLDQELAWRKKELTTIRYLLQLLREHQRRVMLRAAVCVLYAHWEGYIKQAASAYVELVARLGLRYQELAPSFLALGIRGRLMEAGRTRSPSAHTQFVSFFLFSLGERASLPIDDAVDTASNLNSRTLREILVLLGLDDSPYLTKQALIDERLVANRNRIAHGQYLDIQQDDYEVLHSEVLSLIEQFKSDVETAGINGSYRRVS